MHPEFPLEVKENIIESLTSQFPYCKNLQILLAKVYQQNNSVKYSGQLKIAALYASNRTNLYTLLSKKNKELESVIPSKIELVSEIRAETPIEISLNKEEIFYTDKLKNILGSRIHIQHKNLSEKQNSLEDFISIELKNISNENLKEETGIISNSAIEEKVTIEIAPELETVVENIQINISAKEVLKSDTNETSQLVNSENLKIEALVNEVLEHENEPIINSEIEVESFEKETQTENEIKIDSKDFSFFDWLNKNNIKPITPDVKQEVPLSKSHETVKGFTDKDVQEKNSPLADPFEIEINKAKTSEKIVDKFILERPRITPGRTSFFKATDKAKESITENKDLISETLVLIYAKQGNYRKAIQGYERLSLKFPEKSAYFASQIGKIKDYIIKNNIKY